MAGPGSAATPHGKSERMPFTPSRIAAFLPLVRSALAPAALACLGQQLLPHTERNTATTLPSSSA